MRQARGVCRGLTSAFPAAFTVKRVLRKLMRWYVEPAFSEQRIVNDALLRLVDELSRRVDELERRA